VAPHAVNRTIIPKPVTVSFDYVPQSNVMADRGDKKVEYRGFVRFALSLFLFAVYSNIKGFT
jgi:hypothetical protein